MCIYNVFCTLIDFSIYFKCKLLKLGVGALE